MEISSFEEKIGYRFRDPYWLTRALTHSSSIEEDGRLASNERLEFLGDAYLDAVIGTALYRRFPDLPEGDLTKLRSQIVCERSLARVAREIGLGSQLIMGKGEEHLGGRDKDSIIADGVEALIGAVFCDAGFDAMEAFILRLFRELMEEGAEGKLFSDYKTKLQEELCRLGIKTPPVYRIEREDGPPHDKTFTAVVEAEGEILGRGTGKSKKQAEQSAAEEALKERF